MTSYQQFCNGLHQIKHDTNALLDEMLAFAEVMALKQNSLEMDNDIFYLNTTGPLEGIIPATKVLLERLERMKRQKDGT